ncbi:anti-sigma B factor RsbW [Paenibacillus alkaliterrae]|uniref:anti-sigma B factor RsbW n=1 Tax=Paenibacillus alkaliterrae TaxID=320909 RepID=UPI001F48F901|nr:anti-sigma B factor RsbW [Paenibacillus alkaliterrae]MCF2941922.1 anti-sigma B factor RsbW [Paenibacillus alkaliterrae]
MNAIHLQIPAHADYIDMVRICLFGIACKMKFAYEDIEDMKVAVSEACNNAVLYGFQDADSGMIDVSYEFEEQSLTIKVKNSGPEFMYTDAVGKAAPLQAAEVSDLRVGGLGIYLMQALMDDVVVNTASGATEVVMTKYLAAE